MKLRRKRILAAAVIVVLIGFAIYMLVGKLTKPGKGAKVFFQPDDKNRIETSESSDIATKAVNSLGFSIIGKNKENTAIANVAVANMLQRYSFGGAEIKDEINDVLNLEGENKNAFAALNNKLDKTSGYKNIAGFWVDKSLEPKEPSIEINKYYRTVFAGMDFNNSDKAAQKIGDYIKDNSDGKLDKGISQLNQETGMVLAGGNAFEGEFEKAFAGISPHDAEFKGVSETKNVSMLEQMNEVKLYEDDAVQFAVIPLKDGYSLEICLPRNFFEVKVSSGKWQAYSNDAIETPTKISMPVLDINSNKPLEDQFKELGMKKIFEETTDISEVTMSKKLRLGRIDNSVKLNIKNAASGGESEKNQDASMNCNKPFFYAIRHNETGTRIITGQYVNPQ